MRLAFGAALLALASAPFAGAPASAAVTVARPAYLNIVVTSSGNTQQPPRFEVQRLEPIEGDTTLSPRVECTTEFAPAKSFGVRCVPVPERPTNIGGEVTIQGRQCQNAAVRAEISGPAPNEVVTGRITCGDEAVVSAQCSAVASQSDPLAGGFSGSCVAFAPNGPMPIRCDVDLSRVRIDFWRVTCYGTDP